MLYDHYLLCLLFFQQMFRTPFFFSFFFFNDTATTEIYTLSLHDALPIYNHVAGVTNTVRKHRCTKTGGQSQSAAIVRARLALGFCSGIGWLVSRAQRTNHARCGERDEGKQESFERDG